jgi:hypothetical protein
MKPKSDSIRDYWAIKKWLVINKISMKKIAELEGVHWTLVTHTIRGTKNNKKILKRLVTLGCPVESLNLPENLGL